MQNIFIGIAALSFSLPSAAAIITFEYSGTVQSIRQWSGGLSADAILPETSVIPGSVRLGDAFHGRFSFDTNAPSSHTMVPYTADHGRYGEVPVPAATLHFDRGGLSLTGTARMPLVQLGYSLGQSIPETGYVTIEPDFNTNPPGEPSNVHASLNLSGGDGTALQGYALPTGFNLPAFAEHTLGLTWYGDDNQTIFLTGNLNSIASVSAVPEPSSYAMFAFGLVGLGMVLRRGKPHVKG
jgi:hypothetical protein